MALPFLLDENLRGGALWHAIQKHNANGMRPLDVVRVGDPVDLPLQSSDAQILLWAEKTGRMLISFDKSTLPAHLAQHLQTQHTCPGIFIIRPATTIPMLIAFLELAAYAGDPLGWENQITFIP